MPKPPPTELFRVSCEVPVSDLGATIAQLTKLGLANVHFDLITEVRTYAKNVPGISTGMIEEWMADHPTFKAIDVVKHFKERGHGNGTAAYPALAVLVGKGILKKLSPGNYARADVKHRAAPKTKTKAKAKAKPKQFTKTAEAVIVAYAKRNHGRFNTPKLTEIFESEGRARNSLSACIAKLIQQKQIKRVGDPGSGSYVLLQKAAAAKKKPPAPKSNGSAVEATAPGE